MAGGLMNLVSENSFSGILFGNPTLSLFKTKYSKITNFGLQRLRLDFDGNRDLRLTENSTFVFKIKRYAELLLDTHLVFTLPDIYSPIYQPCESNGNVWSSYDFRWIRNIGTNIIKEVHITCGSLTLQKYSGSYINACVERDYSGEKKELFHRMTGDVPELYDPANTNSRNNCYPSAFYTTNPAGCEPSIRGRQLFIPLNTWFSQANTAFPLISLQYNELQISVTLRSIQELFQVRDVFDPANNFPYIQGNFNLPQFGFYRFLTQPPSENIDAASYENTSLTNWNADIHLISTYAFLSKQEATQFASESQVYLLKDIFEYEFQNISGTTKVKIPTNGMVASWMFYLQRNDANMRNEWSNYTNWPYSSIPSDIVSNPASSYYFNPDGSRTGLFVSNDFNIDNQKNILLTMGILLDGQYRENILIEGVYNYIEKYSRTKGAAKDGLYCYNFCLNSSSQDYQPSGAINMSKFKDVYLEISTFIPRQDLTNSNFNVICDNNGTVIGVQKQNWRLYEYTFNLKLFEERYNVLSIIGGNCGMLYSR